ncbi:MAG: hypothetical protein ACODAQ_05455, partial [Phycisphaeraceae bacterium]
DTTAEAPQAAEPFFEAQVRLAADSLASLNLRPRQRVVVRFRMQPKPVLVQTWRWLRQLMQKI